MYAEIKPTIDSILQANIMHTKNKSTINYTVKAIIKHAYMKPIIQVEKKKKEKTGSKPGVHRSECRLQKQQQPRDGNPTE